MDYTLSTFLPECSLSQEPKSRGEIESKVGLPSSNTSMPLLMHLINSVKNMDSKAPQKNNFVNEPESEKKESPNTDNLLWENKNMDIKPHLDEKKSPENNENKPNSNLSSLNDLPSLGKKKGGLEPLNFNPKEDPMGDLTDSVDKEKKNLDEVDKKLKQFENDGMKMEVSKPSPDKQSHKFSSNARKPGAVDMVEDYEDEDFEDDFEATDPKDKNPEFVESGISASQSMGMDPSVNSLDIDEYDHVEQAVINSPFK
jgi:hypothetical protein